MTQEVISANKLVKRYLRTDAVNGVDLSVGKGESFAFLGRNGAGKTTTIKLLTGLLEASGGESRLLGTPSRSLKPEHWQRIGYVSENQKLYEWMRGEELIDFVKPLYPTWDSAFVNRLQKQLQIPLKRRISGYSRGEKVKLSLLIAVAFRPELLILDEPFGGLDALTKDEFLTTLVEAATENRWTLFFSTHDIDEVERLADRVAIVEKGRVVLDEHLEKLQARVKRVIVRGEVSFTPPVGAILIQRDQSILSYVDTRFDSQKVLPPSASVETMSLREIVVGFSKEWAAQERV